MHLAYLVIACAVVLLQAEPHYASAEHTSSKALALPENLFEAFNKVIQILLPKKGPHHGKKHNALLDALLSVTDLGSLLNDVVKKLLEEGEKGEAALKLISKAIIEVTEDSLKAAKLEKFKSERKK